MEKYGCSVKKLKSELYYSSTLCQFVFQVLHYANLIVAHAPAAGTALIQISTICWRMHSKMCDERSSHAHAHANTLTVEITSNARVIWKAHMHVTCVSCYCIWATMVKLLSLGAHAPQGYSTWTCVCVCSVFQTVTNRPIRPTDHLSTAVAWFKTCGGESNKYLHGQIICVGYDVINWPLIP